MRVMNLCSETTVTIAVVGETESVTLRNYYKETDFFVSSEGILKLLSIVTGLAASALLVFGNACMWSPWLMSTGAGVALTAASIAAALYAGALTSIPAYAPNMYFYTDLVLSTASGITLLVFGVLNMTFCDVVSVIDYFHGPLALVNAGLVAGSAIVTYATVMRRLDARSNVGTPPTTSVEHDV